MLYWMRKRCSDNESRIYQGLIGGLRFSSAVILINSLAQECEYVAKLFFNRLHYSFDNAPSKENRFLPSSAILTCPLLRMGSTVSLHS